MKILSIFQLCLAGGEVLALQDNVGSYSHFLDTKSFIYNSGVGADLRGEKNSGTSHGTSTVPRNNEGNILEKKDETEAQNTPHHQDFYPGGLYSPYNPYVSHGWYLPIKDQRLLSLPEPQDDVYKREADLNGAPFPHLGLGVPPGVAPLYGFPYLHPYYSGHSLHQPAQQATEREAVPVYVPNSPAPAPVYRYSPTPLPYTQVVPAPVPVYRYSPLAHPTAPPTAPAPPVQAAPSPTPVYLPPRVDGADVHHPVPGYPPHVPLTPAPSHYSTPHPAYPHHLVPTHPASPTPGQYPHHVSHSPLLHHSQPPPHQVPVTLPPTITREPQALPVPTFAPPVVRTSSLPRLHHDPSPHFNSIHSPNLFEKEDPFLPNKPFVPAQPSPRPGSPVFSRNPSLMSEHLNNNQQRLENILRQHNQEQRMADEPPDASPDPSIPSLSPHHRPSPAPASVSNFSPPTPLPGPLFSQRPPSGRQQPPQFTQNRPQPRPQAPARPPPPPQRPPPQRFLSGSFQNSPASNTRPREGRALQKLLDVAGDDWDTETDINTNLMSSQTSDSFICPAREGNFPDPSSCSTYFTCDHGAAHRNSCGPGLVWSPVIGRCDWGANVRCTSQI